MESPGPAPLSLFYRGRKWSPGGSSESSAVDISLWNVLGNTPAAQLGRVKKSE